MKPWFILLATVCSLLAALVVQHAASAQDDAPAEKAAEPLRHVVLLKFKPEAPAEKVTEIEQAFAGLADEIEEIADLEWGTNTSNEGLSQDFTHCFFVTFESEAGRDAYLPHPAHKAFVEILKPQLDGVLVIDYTPREK